MDLSMAQDLAVRLLDVHGLTAKGWKFGFDNAQTRLGSCNYTKKHITMSKHMVAAAEFDTVEQTLLHELAHALLPVYYAPGKKVGHGDLWKAKAKSLGYRGERTAENPYVAPKRQKSAVAVKTRRATVMVNVDDRVLIHDGREGVIKNIGRKYFHVEIKGKLYGVPFNQVTPLTGKVA